MIKIRKANERGHFDHGWLKTFHTFSFADYYDPRFMGFRTLRVINDDVVAPGGGFGTHAHRDMEIITYVLSGGVAHRDSMGNHGVIKPGEVQRMSAGTGVRHSEMNASDTEPVHLLQIWIMPERSGIAPGYEQKTIEGHKGALKLIAAPTASDGAVTIHQDTRVYTSVLGEGDRVTHQFENGRYGWLHVARGEAEVNGQKLKGGDGAAIEGEKEISLSGNGEVLLFDMP